MTLEWRVTYQVETEIQITPVTPLVPEFGLHLEYSGDGKLIRAVHTFSLDDSLDAGAAFDESENQLALFWEVLRYKSRLPLIARAVGADSPRKVGSRATINVDVGGGTLECALPDSKKLLNAPAGFTTWFHLANVARSALDHADALRIYHIILEGMNADDPKFTYDPKIKYVRHFVSHALIEHNPALAFLQSELGQPVQSGPGQSVRYDPLNRDHRRLVYKYREEAWRLVTAELQKHL